MKVNVKVFLFLLLIFVHDESFAYTEREREIFKSLKCLSCEGQSIIGSEAEFAKSMRSLVKDQISKDKNDKEIYALIHSRYGDEIFFEPPYENATYILWFSPFLALFIGIFLVVFIQKKYKSEETLN